MHLQCLNTPGELGESDLYSTPLCAHTRMRAHAFEAGLTPLNSPSRVVSLDSMAYDGELGWLANSPVFALCVNALVAEC